MRPLHQAALLPVVVAGDGGGTAQRSVRVLHKRVQQHVTEVEALKVEGLGRRRQWRRRETTPGRYVGTLTDAVGPFAGATSGNALHLRFSAPGDEDYEQWLFLGADGQSARNLMTVRKWGIVVARLDETIVKAP